MKIRARTVTLAVVCLLSGTASAEVGRGAPSETPPPSSGQKSPAVGAPVKKAPPSTPGAGGIVTPQKITRILSIMQPLTSSPVTSAEAGKSITLKTTLTAKGAPLTGKSITFGIARLKSGVALPGGPVVLGTATTNAAGAAAITVKVPELEANHYLIEATWGGDDATLGAKASTSFFIPKAKTRIVIKVGPLQSSTGHYAQHGIPQSNKEYLWARVVRDHDSAELRRTVKVTINNKTYLLGNAPTTEYYVDVPSQGKWSAHAVFAGDATTLATHAVYTSP